MRPGIYTDIAPHPEGGFVQATLGADWRTVTVEWVRTTGERTPIWSYVLPSGCNFLRVAVSPQGDVIVVGQDGKENPGPNGALWILTAGAAVSVDGYGYGQYGAVVEWWAGHEAFLVYGARRNGYGTASVTRGGLIAYWVDAPFPKAIADQGGTSQGWLDVLDGELVWTDLARLWPSQHAVQLVCPFTRGGVTVGQVPGDGHGLRAYGAGVASQVAAEDVFEARVAYDPISSVYAVCARLLNFRTLFATCPPWPAIPAAPVVEPPPVVVPPVPVELPRLGVTIDHYTPGGPAPYRLTVDYHVEGHGHAALQVYLTLDGQRVAMETDPAGVLETTVTEPGEYRLGAVVDCAGRRAQTGAMRIVRVTAPVQPPPPPVVPPVPPMPPVPTGRDAYTVAAGEARTELSTPVAVAPVLSIRGKQFYNGDALYVPRWVSGLTLLVKSPEQQAAFLDWATRTGFTGVRVFAGALTWAGQTATSARAALPALLDLATVRGLVCEVTAITDSKDGGYDPHGHLQMVTAIVRGRGNVVLELANEVGHPSQASEIDADRLRQWGRELCDGLLWAVGAASTDEPIDGVYAGHGGRYSTAHLDRGRPSWNNVRRVREIYAIADEHDTPAIDNEPMGADEKHGGETGTKQRWNDPALFFAIGALDRAFGVGGVHHSQAGLMAELPGPVQQQCADAYVAAHAAVDAVLPGVAGSYRNVGHGGSPLLSARFVDGGSEDGVVRAYSFIHGDKGVTVLVGLRGDAGLEYGNGWRMVRTVAGMVSHDGREIVVLEVGR